MSITSVTAPTNQTAIFKDYTVYGRTDRKVITETVFNIIAASEVVAGYTDFEVSGLASYIDTDDTVKISNTTDYDGVYDVYSTPTSNSIRIAIDFVTDETGNVQRYNQNFNFKFEIFNSDDDLLTTKYIYPTYDASDRAQYAVNINAILRDLISENEPTSWTETLIVNVQGGIIQYYYSITEVYDDEDGLSKEVDTLKVDNSGSEYLAYNMYYTKPITAYSIAPYLCDAGSAYAGEDNFCTDRPTFAAAGGESIIFDAIQLPRAQALGFLKLRVKIDRLDSGSPRTDVYIPSSAGFALGTNEKVSFVINETNTGWTTNSVDAEITLQGADAAIWTTISDTYTVTFDESKCNDLFIVFKNFAGGFDTMRFANTMEKIFDTSRELAEIGGEQQDYYVEGVQTRTITSDWLTATQLEWLKQLMMSKQVFRVDSSNAYQRVKIVSKDMIVHEYRELVKMELEIQDQRQKDFRNG